MVAAGGGGLSGGGAANGTGGGSEEEGRHGGQHDNGDGSRLVPLPWFGYWRAVVKQTAAIAGQRAWRSFCDRQTGKRRRAVVRVSAAAAVRVQAIARGTAARRHLLLDAAESADLPTLRLLARQATGRDGGRVLFMTARDVHGETVLHHIARGGFQGGLAAAQWVHAQVRHHATRV